MSNGLSVYFSIAVNLSDWLVLLEGRGEIMCEVQHLDGTKSVFPIFSRELKTKSIEELRRIIELKAEQTPSSWSTPRFTSIPTLVARADTKAA